MKKIIYCKKKQEGNLFAVYDYGHNKDNMTGEVRFSVNNNEVQTEIIKYPDQDELEGYGISKVAFKYLNTLSNGVFPDKMAYEHG